MGTQKTGQSVRNILAMLFTIFLLINAILQTLAVIGGLRHTSLLITPFNEDSSPAIRLILFLVGFGISWVLARMLFQYMIKGKLSVGDSTHTAYVLLLYLMLIFASFCFLNVIGWLWLPLLFLILFLYTIFTLWSLVGGAKTALVCAATLVVILFTILLAS